MITGDVQHDAAVIALLNANLADGSPVAELIDVDYVFLAAIVDPNAAH